MSSEGHKALAFGVATLALVVTALVIGPRLLGFASGPQNEIVLELKKLERTGFDLVVEGKPLRGVTVQYQRLSVIVEPNGERATATGTLDFTGTFGSETVVSSLGFEQLPFALRGGSWELLKGPAPRLQALVLALEQRRRALEAGDASDAGEAVRHARHRVTAWYIRFERGIAEVAEDSQRTGETRERPVDEKKTARLTLAETPDGTFVFAGEKQ